MPRERARTIFAVARGQYGNIGDVMLRRTLLDWARQAGPLHVYLGDAPPGYARGLALRPEDVTYRSLARWYAAALRAAVAGRGAYVFKPGEIQLTLPGLKEHVSMLPLLAVLRARGGRAVRAGVGTRDFAPVPRALVHPSVALSDLTLWRDEATAAYMGVGGVMPDLALAGGSDDETLAGGGRRDALVVSLRGDGERPWPTEQALAAVRAHAERAGLEVWAVTQVSVDDERTTALARALGAQTLPWPRAVGHDAQEEALRALYARAALVLSDRLHVLVAALTQGAVPVAVSAAAGASTTTKIARHLGTIGVHDVDLDLSTTATTGADDAVGARLSALAARRTELVAHLRVARERLAQRREEVLAVLGEEARPTVVHHLGRVGDVAGGMTQVLNGYVAHRFGRVGVDVITSRGEPQDTAASLRLAGAAAVRVLTMPASSSVVVAHLSTRGSFAREGALLRLARARGIATVAHVHGSSFATYAAARPRAVHRVLRRADQVITLSEAASEIAARSVPRERVDLVPNGVAPGAPSAPGDKRDVVVFGGVVSHRKGVDVLQRAWEAVDAPGWELVVAGPVREPHLVRDDVPGMRLAGSLGHADLMALLDSSKVAVLPSRDEAMPMFVLEAMARDVAVVATDVGGVAAVLADGRGTVVPPGDAGALRAALQAVIDDDDLRSRLAGRARAAFEDGYRADRVLARVEDVWLAAAGRAAGRRRSGSIHAGGR